MNSAIVTITSDPVQSFIQMSGDESVQISHCLVQIAQEPPAEHIAIWSSGETILLDAQKELLRKLKASNPTALVSFVVKDSEGHSAVLLPDEASLNAFPIAASIAVIKASWGWDESESIVVRINDAQLKVQARYDGVTWIASEHA